MKIIIISTCWNIERFIEEYIYSIKNQTYANFIVYLIDDMSSDNTFTIAQKCINKDIRFNLIKNTEKKWKVKNFIDVIKNNKNIDPFDILVEIDPDDKLKDEYVLEKIYKIFKKKNIWICGTKWEDFSGKISKYGRIIPEKARTGYTIFSHMRSYRAFLFRAIRDEDLQMNGEYFKAACDIAIGIPMLEMAGTEHYYFLDEVMYIYRWYDTQSYSENSSHGDTSLQKKSASYILKLPKYKKIVLNNYLDKNNIIGEIV